MHQQHDDEGGFSWVGSALCLSQCLGFYHWMLLILGQIIFALWEMQKSSIRVLGEEAAAAGGASISFQGKNVTRLPEGQRTWPKLLQIDKTFLTLWCYFCFACNAYCPSAHPAAAACLASCPLFQWPCPFIILSLFVPPPLHPAPILTVGIKAHHFGLVWCYTEDKKHIVRFFVEMFQSCLITLLQTNSATFLIPAITGCFIQDSFSMPPRQRRILLLCLLFH